jgi:hypothetical protein
MGEFEYFGKIHYQMGVMRCGRVSPSKATVIHPAAQDDALKACRSQ